MKGRLFDAFDRARRYFSGRIVGRILSVHADRSSGVWPGADDVGSCRRRYIGAATHSACYARGLRLAHAFLGPVCCRDNQIGDSIYRAGLGLPRRLQHQRPHRKVRV